MTSGAKASSSGLSNKRRIPRIIYNDDTCSLRHVPPPHTEQQISIPVDYLKGTQVDCLCWCVDEQIVYSWPSKVVENENHRSA